MCSFAVDHSLSKQTEIYNQTCRYPEKYHEQSCATRLPEPGYLTSLLSDSVQSDVRTTQCSIEYFLFIHTLSMNN